jgi:AraC-like DNA-binding protein
MSLHRPFHIEVDYSSTRAEPGTQLLAANDPVSELSTTLPPVVGSGTIRIKRLRDDFGIGELDILGAYDDCTIEVAQGDRDFRFPFLTAGDQGIVGLVGGEEHMTVNPHVSFILSPDSVGTVFLPAGRRLRHTCLFVSQPLLERLAGEDARAAAVVRELLREGRRRPCVQRGVATLPIRAVVEQIRSCELRGSLRALYLEGKYLELLSRRLAQLLEQDRSHCRHNRAPLTRREQERLSEARAILDAELDNPPSIAKLARRVGLNTTKLKSGFKLLFRETIFAHVCRLRMRYARSLLLDTDMTVSEVAHAVGYANPAAFTVAFKRELGYCPSNLKKHVAAGALSPQR